MSTEIKVREHIKKQQTYYFKENDFETAHFLQ